MKTTTIPEGFGLCNRIKNIWSALEEYEDIKTTTDSDAYIFPTLEKVNTPINTYPLGWRLKVQEEEQKYIDGYKTIDFLYESTPQYFIDKYLKSVEKLKINQAIVDYVSEFTSGWDNYIGVHIRSWFNDRVVMHDNKIFEKEIDKLSGDRKIFLCSDNTSVINHFKQKYGDRIVTHPQALHSQASQTWKSIGDEPRIFNDVQLVVDGFIDCYILSKCSTIIGTYGSTFAEVSWWLSKCKSNVIIPDPTNEFNRGFVEEFTSRHFLKK